MSGLCPHRIEGRCSVGENLALLRLRMPKLTHDLVEIEAIACGISVRGNCDGAISEDVVGGTKVHCGNDRLPEVAGAITAEAEKRGIDTEMFEAIGQVLISEKVA